MRSVIGTGVSFVLAVLGASLHARAGLDTQYSGGIQQRINSTTVYSESYNLFPAGGQGSVDHIQNSDPEQPDLPYYVMRATSSAGSSYVSASTYAEIVKSQAGFGGFAYSVGGLAYGGTYWDDFVIQGPPGGIVTRLGARVTGRVSLGTSAMLTGDCSVQVVIWVNDSIRGSGTYAEHTDGGNRTINESGGLIGFDGDATLLTNTAFLPTNTPFRVGLQLTVSSSIGLRYENSGSGSSNMDFLSTLRLVTNQPLFDLPPGYTVTSAQAHVIDNYFINPCPADFNHDSLVDDADFTSFVTGYNILDCADSAMHPGCPADLNFDALVDDADFVIFLNAYSELVCP